MAITSGLMTGLMGFSLKKEMLGDALFYRELATYHYEIYSLDLTGWNRTNIQNTILNEFNTKYSGDINVKVFSQPADYYFPNDAIRVAKFNVEVQVKSVPSINLWQAELATGYYKGLDSTFFINSGRQLLDFKEGFNFAIADNGIQTFSHDISFGLMTGDKSTAISIASGIFAQDKNTTFGISVMVSGLGTIADPTIYQNYYSESYDTIRNQYSFSRKRDVLLSGSSTYVYNLVHVLELRQDGIIDVSEKGTVKGKLTFNQAQAGAETLIGTSFSRCNSFYSTYSALANNYPYTMPSPSLVNLPVRTSRVLNPRGISVDYDIGYTNNTLYLSDGTMVEEVIDLADREIGITDIKHSIDFTIHKRVTNQSAFTTLINNAFSSSPAKVSGYYQSAILNYNANAGPISNIKSDIVWPNRKNKGAKVVMEYSNNKKYFSTINGVSYRVLDFKLAHSKPADIITEYKIL